MNDLAEWIAKGLALDIRESPSSKLMSMSFDGYSGNIVAIALAGKVGRARARKMIENALPPKMTQSKSINFILQELGLTLEQCDALARAHLEHSAAAIAERLRSGWTLDAVSSHVYPQRDEHDAP
jgi:hypothetical protein